MNDTNIILYKDIEFTNQNTIKFADKNKQTAYFNSKIFGRINQYEKIIVDSIAVSDYDYYQLQEVTYISTQRVIAGKSKTYYYRVIEIEYSNDGLTILNVNLDTIQTYMFDYEVENAAIIREHEPRWDGNDERIFSKTREGIDINEYEYTEIDLFSDLQKDRNIYAVIITAKYSNIGSPSSSYRYGDIPKGFRTYLTFIIPEKGDYPQVIFNHNNTSDISQRLINQYEINRLSTNPNIYDIYITPYIPDVIYSGVRTGGAWGSDGVGVISGFKGYDRDSHYSVVNKITIDGGNEDITFSSGSNSQFIIEIKDMRISNGIFKMDDNKADQLKNMLISYDGFDSKIYGAQYSSIELVSGVDNRTVLYADEFLNTDINFGYTISNDMNKMIVSYPTNYRIPNKQAISGTENSIAMITNAYIEHMNNSRNSISSRNTGNIVKAVVGTTFGVATAVAGTAASGGAFAPMAIGVVGSISNNTISQVFNVTGQNAELRDLKNRPDKIDVTGDVDYNITNGYIKTRLYLKQPTLKDKRILHNYFKLNGYASNRIGKLFNNNLRENYNFIQTGNMVITGNIPAIDKEELKQIYGAGIRLWHNPDTFLNFEIDNDEVI